MGIGLAVGLALAAVCAVISILQFLERGFLFNNAYLYASERERKTMDKKPYYRQSGIVFAFLSAIFLCVALECALETLWLWWGEGALLIALLVYAVASSVKGNKL